jgi:chorismate mutase
MGTTHEQRRDIEDMENLAAVLHTADEVLRLLALHTRRRHLLDEIAHARASIQRGQEIVWRQREQLHKDAGG